MDAVAALENFQGSLQVSRLEHSLQSATRAYRAENCFDPDYDSLPLEFFRPMVEEVFSRPRYLADRGDP